MQQHTRKSAFSLVEILVVTIILAVMVVSFLALSTQETATTRDIRDRATALGLARNLISLVRHQHNRVWLDGTGTPGPGGFRYFDPSTILEYELAYGTALKQWTEDRQASVTMGWRPDPGGGPVGRINCLVKWINHQDKPRQVQVPAVLER